MKFEQPKKEPVKPLSEYRPIIMTPEDSQPAKKISPEAVLPVMPEIIPNNQKLSWAEKLAKLKPAIADWSGQLYNKAEQLAGKFKTKDLGEGGGQLYAELAAKSAWYGERPLINRAPKIDNKEKAIRAVWQDHHRQSVGDSEKVDYQVIATAHGRFEFKNIKHEQAGGRNIINEQLDNFYNDARLDCRAHLEVVDKASGQKIDLNKLLPADFDFVPAWQVEKQQQLAKGQKPADIDQVLSLKNYPINKQLNIHEDEFSMEEGRIVYGDLAKKGGVLGLLHEIGHAWQFQRSAMTNRDVMDKIIERAKEVARLQADGQPVPAEQPFAVKAGKPQQPGPHDFSIKVDKAGKEIAISSQQLTRVLNEYIHEERDAWAHAIRVFRFLRQQGLDLDPELKTGEDIQGYVNQCLGSYQKSLEKEISAKGLDYNFVRTSAKK
jgi:hypothetical protein